MKRRTLFVLLAGSVLWAGLAGGCDPYPGKLRESREQANKVFQIRLEIYDEGNKAHIFEPGCHIKLLSAPVGSRQWVQFGNAYFSRCDQDLRNRVRFVNDETGYVFMQWWYSVTTDGGRTWSTWDVAAHLPGKAFYNPRLIEEVSISADGKGTMTLNPEGVAQKQRLTLYTTDFGRDWRTS
jgi:hypothetical protein